MFTLRTPRYNPTRPAPHQRLKDPQDRPYPSPDPPSHTRDGRLRPVPALRTPRTDLTRPTSPGGLGEPQARPDPLPAKGWGSVQGSVLLDPNPTDPAPGTLDPSDPTRPDPSRGVPSTSSLPSRPAPHV